MPPLGQITAAYSAGKPEAGASGSGASFASMIGEAASSALATLRNGETTTAAGLAGKADVQDVVQALSNAEMTVQTVVAVRDKVLNAYNAIMSMTV